MITQNQTITKTHWEKIEKQYGGLLRDIGKKIYNSNYALEDIIQELKLKVVKTLIKYCNKYNLTYDQALEDDIFPKYLKTSLWNWRNTECRNIIKQKESFNNINKFISLDDINSFHPEDKSAPLIFANFNFNDSKYKLSEIQKDIVNLILEDGECFLENNSLNHAYLCRKLNIGPIKLQDNLNLIKNKIGK